MVDDWHGNGREGYEGDAGRAIAETLESLDPERLQAWLISHLPNPPAAILDIGAGTGRDAAWLAGRGYEVVAAEPSHTMRTEAVRRHGAGPNARIRWVDDALPGLDRVTSMGASFDLILLSAVWMHIAPSARRRAFRKLVGLLKPGGRIALSLRRGPVPPGRVMYPVSATETIGLARDHGMAVAHEADEADVLGRLEVSWQTLVLHLPDDGTGALPLLRHVILNDAKSSTYKLGLLRAVTRAADANAGMAVPADAPGYGADEEHGGEVEKTDADLLRLPLGLIALNWLRLYVPLLRANLPQAPGNRSGTERIGFVDDGHWVGLGAVSPLDLRVGRCFTGPTASALHAALRSAASTVARMPATFMTWPGTSEPVMPARLGRAGPAPAALQLNERYLQRFGTIDVPSSFWRAMARFAHWIEPALLSEWQMLMEGYAHGQGRTLDPAVMARALRWHDPAREVGEARRIAQRLLDDGPLHCVWTGRRLPTLDQLDIDHCLPWSAWPCGDLWNLMPAARSVNQRHKRDLLPSARLIDANADRIAVWWEQAYLAGEATANRFRAEAASSLAINFRKDDLGLTDVHDGLQMRRLALRTDQRVAEWDGMS